MKSKDIYIEKRLSPCRKYSIFGIAIHLAIPERDFLLLYSTFRTSKNLPKAEPKILSKKKSCRIGSALRGSPLLQGFPSFPHSPPDCGENSPFSERTASSASRKCVSFFWIPDLESFSSCEKAYESVPCANKGLCPFETCKPLKRLDLNFLTSLF